MYKRLLILVVVCGFGFGCSSTPKAAEVSEPVVASADTLPTESASIEESEAPLAETLPAAKASKKSKSAKPSKATKKKQRSKKS